MIRAFLNSFTSRQQLACLVCSNSVLVISDISFKEGTLIEGYQGGEFLLLLKF